MDLFENLKDIEKVYEDLVNNAKNLNLKEIENYRDNEQRTFERFIIEKNELVNDVLGTLAKEANKKISNFEDKLDGAIKKIELQFQKSIRNLQKIIIEEKREKVSDFVGDTLFILLKIANQTKVDAEKSLENTLSEYEKRMPPEAMKKVKHANPLAGGVDNKTQI